MMRFALLTSQERSRVITDFEDLAVEVTYHGITLNHSHLKCLIGNEWLNDEIMTVYSHMLIWFKNMV